MIAVALGVIAAVLLLAVGVVTAAATPDSLTFFGASIRTTSAQIFLIGAICTWALLVASWLLMVGIRRSRERSVQLAAIRRRWQAAKRGAGAGGPANGPAIGLAGGLGGDLVAGLVERSAGAEMSDSDAVQTGISAGTVTETNSEMPVGDRKYGCRDLGDGAGGCGAVDREADTVVFSALADRAGLRGRRYWNPSADERAQVGSTQPRPVEE